MNLPATAVEFLDAFEGVFTDLQNQDAAAFDEVYGETMPWVHCHAFSKGPTSAEGEQDVRKVRSHLRTRLGQNSALTSDPAFHFILPL